MQKPTSTPAAVIDTEDSAEEHGAEAARAGKKLTDNPFIAADDSMDEFYLAWQRGWQTESEFGTKD